MKRPPQPPRIVDDLMTDDLITVKPADTIGQARNLLLALGINAIPVIDAEAIVGILTSPDLADDWAENLPVSAAMSRPVHRIHPEASLSEAAEQMLTLNIHHLIVEGHGRIGIITSFDLLRTLSQSTAS